MVEGIHGVFPIHGWLSASVAFVRECVSMCACACVPACIVCACVLVGALRPSVASETAAAFVRKCPKLNPKIGKNP